MRLLDTETGRFVEEDPEKTKYAILSHTWEKEGEQTYEQLRNIQRRYDPGCQNPQGRSGVPKASFPERDQDGPSSAPSSSQFPSVSLSTTTTTTRPPIALGHLTESEVEALFRAFIRTYGLASPTSASASGDAFAPSREWQSQPPSMSIWDDPELSPKIRDACAVARKNGYRYIWIDSCCIDKSSSSELSEAINSMYKWYGLAKVCYAYLAEVPSGDDHKAGGSSFRRSRWFKRGWTLQELIAPFNVEFLSEDWASIGSKQALVDLVEDVTNINSKALLRLVSLDMFSIAQRLSWAANRETTRVEDRAYSLLGIFDIHMPTLYGEGDRAFRRLQEQIMQRIPDQSLFAWGRVYLPEFSFHRRPDLASVPETIRVQVQRYHEWWHLFSTSPDYFKGCESVSTRHSGAAQPASIYLPEIEYTSTPYGIRTQFQMIPLTPDLLRAVIPYDREVQLEFISPKDYHWYLVILRCEHADQPGHLLGRICYIPPPHSAGVEFVYTGFINVESSERSVFLSMPDLFPLSPELIKRFLPLTKLKTVYVPHPDRATLPSSLQHQPYAAIKLVLVRDTRNALCTRGYSADLCGPDPDHPTTHRLTLSRWGYTIAVEFQHALEGGGRQFAISADVPDSYQADRSTVSWTDGIPWYHELDHQRVRLSGGAGTLVVDLGLDFAGNGVYSLDVDVLCESPPHRAAVGVAKRKSKRKGSAVCRRLFTSLDFRH